MSISAINECHVDGTSLRLSVFFQYKATLPLSLSFDTISADFSFEDGSPYRHKCAPLRLFLTLASIRPATTSAHAMSIPNHVRSYRYFLTPNTLSPRLLGLLSVRGPDYLNPPRAPECPRSCVPELLSDPTGPIPFLYYLDSSCLQVSYR